MMIRWWPGSEFKPREKVGVEALVGIWEKKKIVQQTSCCVAARTQTAHERRVRWEFSYDLLHKKSKRNNGEKNRILSQKEGFSAKEGGRGSLAKRRTIGSRLRKKKIFCAVGERPRSIKPNRNGSERRRLYGPQHLKVRDLYGLKRRPLK